MYIKKIIETTMTTNDSILFKKGLRTKNSMTPKISGTATNTNKTAIIE